jgi:hypothetical protein
MVSFRRIIAAAACAMPALAVISTADTVSNIETLTQMTQTLQRTADEITLVNGALTPLNQGPYPKIIDGFKVFVNKANTYEDQSRGSPPLRKGIDSDSVYGVYNEVCELFEHPKRY